MSEEREPGEQMGSDSKAEGGSADPVGDRPEQQMRSESESEDLQSNSGLESGETSGDQRSSDAGIVDSPDEPVSTDPEKNEVEAGLDSGGPPASDSKGCGYFLKRGFRWAVFVLVIFTIGVLVMQFVRVQPLNDERNSLNASLVEARALEQALQADLDRLEGVEEQNQALSASLEQSEARLALLNILVDVSRAQLALAQEDTVRVAAALQGTGEKLNSLGDLVAASELRGLRERLVLVLSEVDGDPFAAERDLEILANTLLEIEQELAGE